MTKLIRPRTRLFAVVFFAVLAASGSMGSLLRAQSALTMPEDKLPVLEEQLEIAMQSSPKMILRQAETAVTHADYKASQSSRYPSLGGWANYLWAEDDRNNAIGGARPATKLGYNFTIRKSLYYWGNLERGIQNWKIQTLIEEGNTRQAYMTLASDIRELFMNLVAGKHRLGDRRFRLEQRRTLVEETREKQRQNLSSPAEVFRAELDLQRAELEVLEAEDEFAHSLRVLSRLTGGPLLTEDDIPNEFPVPPYEEQDSVLVAMAARFLADEMPENTSIQIAKYQIEKTENDLKNSRTSLRPRLDAMVGISQDEQDFALDTDSYEYQSIFGGVSMTWNLFDGFATRNYVKSGLSRLRAAEINLANEQQELVDNVRALGLELKRRGMAIKIQEQELQSARSNLEYTQGLAERGEASASDVDGAYLNVSDNIRSALYHRYEYWNKLSDFLGLIDADPILNRPPPIQP
jgi:outer membrane protein TolC